MNAKYALQRLAQAVVVVWIVVSAVFVALNVAPGDPTSRLADPRVPVAQRERLREIYGLDRPILVRYGLWLAAAARGDWGLSLVYQRPVGSVVREALPASLLLGLTALSIGTACGLLAGAAAAVRAGTHFDRGLRVLTSLVHSTPVFWLGLMAILIFSLRLGWLPSSHQYSSDGEGGWLDLARHLVLPAGTLALVVAADVSRMMRAKFLWVLSQEFIRAARAKGLSERRVLLRHALPNALGPTIQTLGLILPVVISGSIAIEIVFSWPGLGRVALDALAGRDLPLLAATTIVSALLVVAGTFAADLASSWLDPRTQRERPR